MKQRKTESRRSLPSREPVRKNIPVSEEYIHSLVGCCKGEGSLVEAREREHKLDDQAKDQKLWARSREVTDQDLRG